MENPAWEDNFRKSLVWQDLDVIFRGCEHDEHGSQPKLLLLTQRPVWPIPKPLLQLDWAGPYSYIPKWSSSKRRAVHYPSKKCTHHVFEKKSEHWILLGDELHGWQFLKAFERVRVILAIRVDCRKHAASWLLLWYAGCSGWPKDLRETADWKISKTCLAYAGVWISSRHDCILMACDSLLQFTQAWSRNLCADSISPEGLKDYNQNCTANYWAFERWNNSMPIIWWSLLFDHKTTIWINHSKDLVQAIPDDQSQHKVHEQNALANEGTSQARDHRVDPRKLQWA